MPSYTHIHEISPSQKRSLLSPICILDANANTPCTNHMKKIKNTPFNGRKPGCTASSSGQTRSVKQPTFAEPPDRSKTAKASAHRASPAQKLPLSQKGKNSKSPHSDFLSLHGSPRNLLPLLRHHGSLTYRLCTVNVHGMCSHHSPHRYCRYVRYHCASWLPMKSR